MSLNLLSNNAYLIIIALYAIVIGVEVVRVLRFIRKPEFRVRLDAYFSRLVYTVLGTGLLLFCVSILFRFNYVQYKSPVPYRDYKTIKMSDFVGFKQPKKTLDGSESFAFITSNIEYWKEGSNVYVVTYFHPSRSYTFSKETNEKLLEHELYHFHIAEYWARKLREKVSAQKALPTSDDLDLYYAGILKKERMMQARYDDETYHSYVRGKQIEWQERVDSLLSTVEDYSAEKVEF